MIRLNCYMMSGRYQTAVGPLRIPDAVAASPYMRAIMRHEAAQEEMEGNFVWMLDTVHGEVPGGYTVAKIESLPDTAFTEVVRFAIFAAAQIKAEGQGDLLGASLDVALRRCDHCAVEEMGGDGG